MMPLRQKIFAFMLAVIILVAIFELVRKRKLREEYSWLWIITGFSILLVVWRYDPHRADLPDVDQPPLFR